MTLDANWVAKALNTLEDKRPADALASFYEGLGLRTEHPSFSVVAFVTAIERTGDFLFGSPKDPPPCKLCNQRPYNPRRELFVKALQLAVRPERVAWLMDTYGKRSGTAHSGRLYGSEFASGDPTIGGSVFTSEPGQFEALQYFLMHAAKTLLRKVLGNDVSTA